MLCAPRQLAKVLKLEMADVCREMDEVERKLYGTENWQEDGATPRMVFEFCRARGFGAVCVHLEAVVETLAAEPGNPTVAFVVHESHCYFYSSLRACRALADRQDIPYDKLRREPGSSDTPAASTWKPWEYKLEPGHYHVPEGDLPSVRAWFLISGRSPKCVLKDQVRLKSRVQPVP